MNENKSIFNLLSEGSENKDILSISYLDNLFRYENTENIKSLINKQLEGLKKIYLELHKYKVWSPGNKFIQKIKDFDIINQYEQYYNDNIKNLITSIEIKIKNENQNIHNNNFNNINKLLKYYSNVHDLYILQTNNLKYRLLKKYLTQKSKKIENLIIELEITIKSLLEKKQILQKINGNDSNININIKNKLLGLMPLLNINKMEHDISNETVKNIKNIRFIIYLKNMILKLIKSESQNKNIYKHNNNNMHTEKKELKRPSNNVNLHKINHEFNILMQNFYKNSKINPLTEVIEENEGSEGSEWSENNNFNYIDLKPLHSRHLRSLQSL